MDMRLRSLVTLLSAAALVSSPAVSARPEGPAHERPVTLGHVNAISAARPGWIDVVVPAAAKLDFPLLRRNRDLSVEGAGRFAGIILTKGPRPFEGPTLVGAVIRTCGRPACASGRPVMLTNPMNMNPGSRIRLPAGDYRLYVVTDGAPVDVRLTLHGLSGSRSISPTAAADVSVGNLPVHVGGGDANPVYVSGGDATVDRPAWVMDGLWLGGRPSGFTDLGTCLYDGPPPKVPEAVAYSPACEELGAEARASTTMSTATRFSEMLLLFDSPLEAGTWSAGAHLECTCYPERLTSLRVVVRR